MQIPTEPIWVDQDHQLQQLCQRWQSQAAIAVDTEFMRSDTFYPIAGLIQIGDGEGCYLIDPLAFDDLTPLAKLMADTKVTKVLHACSEDLEVFNVLLDVVPSPLFDTQIAAAFAGLGFSLGYAALAAELLSVDIPKGETRSDWLQRPLSAAQLKYAALDVAHMLIIYGKLLQKLKPEGRLEWVQADCAALVGAARTAPDFSQYYRKIGQAWKLPASGLAIAQRLCQWREQQARARDIPRNRIIKEQPLFAIARSQPGNLGQLQRIEGIPKRTLNEDADTLLSLVAEALAQPASQQPEPLPAPLGREHRALLKALKHYVREEAEQQNLPPEILIRKKEYESIVRTGFNGGDYRLPERLKGWRYDVIGEGLLQVANSVHQEAAQ